jgi:rSAM/selenodomain-associated transferase 1
MRSAGLLARWPSPGRVKTRLGPALPADLACRLHAAMTCDTLEALAQSPVDRRVLFLAGAPEILGAPHPERIWPGLFEAGGASATPPAWIARVELRAQAGADLGARLGSAFTTLLRAPGDRAVVVGSDAPDLDAARIAEAFDALERSDLVLGPARDGGYYLIGLARGAPELFASVPWGTDRVLATTLAIARDSGMATARLAELEDVDTPADLTRWLARSAAAAPDSRAIRALRSMRLLPDAPSGAPAGATATL